MIALKKQSAETLSQQIDPGRAREKWPDVYRGIAIAAVVIVHCTGHLLSQLTPASWSWYLVACANRSLQFAVPAFLLVSAYLNGASLTKSRSRQAPIALIARRLRAIGIPYLLASAAGVWIDSHGSLASVATPHFIKLLILGRAAYHLYFVLLLAQLYVVLPLVMRLFNRPRRLSSVLFVAAVIQLLAFALNGWMSSAPALHGFRANWPTVQVESSLLWYVAPIALGIWLLSQSQCGRPIVVPKAARYVALAGFVCFLPLSVLSMVQAVNSLGYQLAEWVYTASASLVLVGIASRLQGSKWLAALGRNSLTIYLVHPFIIDALDFAMPGVRDLSFWLAGPIYLGIAISGCMLLSSAGLMMRRTAGAFGR